MDFDQDSDAGRRNRMVVFSLLGVVTLVVVAGLFVGGLNLAAVRTDDLAGAEPTEQRTRPVPTEQTSEPDPEPEPEPEPTEPSRRPPAQPVLEASPTSVGSLEPIDLGGRFPRLGGGVSVKVQRNEGGSWVDFPEPGSAVTATTDQDGSFRTYVQTGQTGVNRFRVVVVSSGRSTPAIRVRVG